LTKKPRWQERGVQDLKGLWAGSQMWPEAQKCCPWGLRPL